MSSTQISFNQIVLLVKKFEARGWNANRITQLGQAPAKKFRAIEAILDGVPLNLAQKVTGSSGTDTTYLHYLESAIIAPTAGTAVLADAGDVFSGFLDSDLKNWNTNVTGTDTDETGADVYEMKQDGDYRTLFGSFGIDVSLLCWQQGQIKEFCRTNRHMLRQGGYGTLFVFEANKKLFVASVFVHDGELGLSVYRFEYGHVWRAGYRHRLVVPQQTL